VITPTGQIIGKAAQPGNEGQQDCPEVQMESVRFWELKARPELSEGNTFTGDYVSDLAKPDAPSIRWVRYYVPKKNFNQYVPPAQPQN